MSVVRGTRLPRRTINDLQLLYSLERSVLDVYVEGPSDRLFLTWFIKKLDIQGVYIYWIDTVDVPKDLILERGLDNNAKGRVITLCMVLGELLGGCPLPNVACIVDNDLDVLLGLDEVGGECVLRTDFASLEMYAFNSD